MNMKDNNSNDDDDFIFTPISGLAGRKPTTSRTPVTSSKTKGKNEQKITLSAFHSQNFLQAGDLRTTKDAPQLEFSSVERSPIEKTTELQQLLAENAKLRDGMDFLRTKISHLESKESALECKIAEIESLKNNNKQYNEGEKSLRSTEEQATDDDTWGNGEEENHQGEEDEGDDEHQGEEETLPHDTFSLMVVSPTCSTPFWLSFIVVFFQITAFSLVASSIIEIGNSRNPFSIPANVEAIVRFTQIVAIVIAIITQDDIRTGLNLFLDGYEPEELCRAFPCVTYKKWVVSIIARLMEGGLSVVVTFLLIMTAETVVDLLLNFTAMQFVSQLDEVCFFMCREGFFGRSNAYAAKMVAKKTYRKVTNSWKGSMRRTVFLILLGVALFAGWFTISHHQNRGRYLCSTVFIQFADELNPVLGLFSGLYDQRSSENGIFSIRNFEYVDRRSGVGIISYCVELGAWTFTTINREGPCDWMARSEATKTFDLTETASLTWYARNSINREAIIEQLFLSCYECDNSVTRDGYHTRCGGRGLCENAVCSCEDGWYGLRCEFREPCQSLEFDSRFGPFQGNHIWSSVYDRFELDGGFVDVYNRPVYISENGPGLYDILLFTGRRWGATYSAILPVTPEDGESAKEALARYFDENFHPAVPLGRFSMALASEPVDVGTFADNTSPAGLGWNAFQSFAMNSQDVYDDVGRTITPIPSLLLCAVCNNRTNACLYDGECIDGTCRCSIGSSGALCQNPPIGNGRCDLFYNTLEFEYDGGDCCESTCVSSAEFTCGKDESGFFDMGYFFCHLPAEGWRLNGEAIVGEDTSGSGHSVRLSDSGEIFAVAEPVLDRVRLFDKVGSQWIPRDILEGRAGIYFGASIASSSGSANMVNNPFATVPFTIAVGNSFSPILYVSVFECSTACAQVGDDLVAIQSLGPLMGVVDMSHDGEVVVAGARQLPSPESGSSPYPLASFRKDYRGDWVRQKLDMSFRDSEGVHSIALSGSGDVLAVASFQSDLSPTIGLWIANNTRRVYEWHGTFWAQRGSTMVEAAPHRALLFDAQGQSMDISFDGTVLASGLWTIEDTRGTHTRIFAWDNTESDWIQRGSSLICGDWELQGRSISLSSDGEIVAIVGADYSGIEGFAPPRGGGGEVCSFNWNGVEWISLGDPLDGAGWSSVSLSADGSDLAVGFEDETLVYEFPRNNCPQGTSQLRLSVTTDAEPQSTTWSVLSNGTGEILAQGGPYSVLTHFFASFVEEICVAPDECVIFTVYDHLDLNAPPGANGINQPGGYALFVDGERLPGGNVTSAVERVHVGNCLTCPAGTRLFRMLIQTCAPVAWTLVGSSGEVLFSKNSFETYFERFDNDCGFADQTTYWEEVCLSLDECFLFSILAPPVRTPNSTTGDGSEVIIDNFLPPRPNLQYRLFIDETEIASNATRVFGNSEQNGSVPPVTIGNCGR